MLLNLKQITDIENETEVKLYPKRGISIARGEGVYLIDTEGKKYLDFMTNLGVNILGYSNPEITNAISRQLGILPSTHQTFYSEPRAAFLKELKTIISTCFYYSCYHCYNFHHRRHHGNHHHRHRGVCLLWVLLPLL